MLQNAYLLAKIGADTAENEQHFAEILPKIDNYPTGPPRRQDAGHRLGGLRAPFGVLESKHLSGLLTRLLAKYKHEKIYRSM